MSVKIILKSAGIVVFFTVFSKIIGFVRDILLTSKLGILPIADVFSIAFAITPVLAAFAGISTIQGTVISVFSELIHSKQTEKLSEAFSSLFNLILVYCLILFALLSAFPSALSKIFAPGFSFEKNNLLLNLIPLVLLYTLTKILSDYVNSLLVALKRFSVSSIPLVFPSLLMILALIFLPLEEKILKYLLWANIVGTCFYFAFFQFPELKKNKIKFSFAFNFKDENIKKIIKLSLPLMFTMGSVHLALSVDRAIASCFEDGVVTALRVSGTTTKMFYNLLIIPIFGVFLSYWSEFSAKNDTEGLEKSFFEISELTLFVSCLISIVFVSGRNEILSLMYERGNFDAKAVNLTSLPMIYYALDIILNCVYALFTYLFLATKRNKILGISGPIAFVSNIVLSLTLSKILGFSGIALATALSSLIYALILFNSAKNVFTNIFENSKNSIKVVLIGFSVGLLGIFISNFDFVQPLTNSKFTDNLLEAFVKCGFITLVFLVLTYFFKVNKIGSALKFLKGKLKK
ncbi:polysaccharide biosynthesis protein [bacterium]|nr:polysaccharide biosynthesis protein [bacterium]